MSKAEPIEKREGRKVRSIELYSRGAAGVGIERTPTVAEEEPFWRTDTHDTELREEYVPEKPRDLLERTAQFGQAVIFFAKRIPRNTVNEPLINKLVKSGTSIGANYCEADDPLSRKDYLKSIGICRKESKETKYWLRMIATSESSLQNDARRLWQEAKELNLIFGAIFRKK